MKFTKRIFATLLAFALALTLVLPAAAAVDWSEFKITKQPQSLTIKHGESFTLSVEVKEPEGVEVKYQWNTGATTPELHLGPDDRYYPSEYRFGGASTDFTCNITAYEKDDDGNLIATRYLKSNRARVETERTFLGKLIDVTIGPFGYAFTAVALMLPLWPIFPVAYIGFLFYFFVQGFIGLF